MKLKKLLILASVVGFASLVYFLPIIEAKKQAENFIPELKPGEKMAIISGIGMF